MTKMFRINKYITLELRDGKTVVLLNNSEFLICAGVFVDINTRSGCLDYDSVDKLIDDEYTRSHVSLSPEEEFWVHCSNLQAWSENNYDTKLLHSNIAFPLLKGLVRLGDPRAKRAFKDELVKRLLSDYAPTIIFLLKAGYLDVFTDEEFDVILSEVKKKAPTLDRLVLNMMFIGEDFDEVPPLERFKPRAILFLIEHPNINLFELFIKFGHLYIRDYYPWIFKFFERLIKKEPIFFENKIESLLQKGDLVLPKRIANSKDGEPKLDYSEMDDFSKVFFTRYLRNNDKVISRINDTISE